MPDLSWSRRSTFIKSSKKDARRDKILVQRRACEPSEGDLFDDRRYPRKP
jgi:hypothetical protein